MISIVETKNPKLLASLAEDVQNLHARLYPETFKPFELNAMEEAMENLLQDPTCRSYVAKKDEVAIGYVLCFIREIKENAFHFNIKSIYIDQICVLKGYEKTGAGTLLMNQIESLAKELNIQKIELDHWSANTVAASFFRRRGYGLNKERLFKFL